MIDRRTVFVVLLALVLGWWTGSRPAPAPVPDRPIAAALVRLARAAARWGLWLAVAAEPAPAPRHQLVRAPRLDAAGHPVVDHSEGW